MTRNGEARTCIESKLSPVSVTVTEYCFIVHYRLKSYYVKLSSWNLLYGSCKSNWTLWDPNLYSKGPSHLISVSARSVFLGFWFQSLSVQGRQLLCTDAKHRANLSIVMTSHLPPHVPHHPHDGVGSVGLRFWIWRRGWRRGHGHWCI